LVPEADRAAQPGCALVVGVEERQHLAEERPNRDGAEERREAERELAPPSRQPEADRCEEEVNEPAVGVVPGAVRERRPGDREREPRDERREGQQDRPALWHAADGEEHDDEEQRAATEPRQRPVLRGASEEESETDKEEGRGEGQVPDRPHLARSYHPPPTCREHSQKPYSDAVASCGRISRICRQPPPVPAR